MPFVALPAYFDGEKACLDEPFDLRPGTRLIVTVLGDTGPGDEDAGWTQLSLAGLASAYAEDEPDYSRPRGRPARRLPHEFRATTKRSV